MAYSKRKAAFLALISAGLAALFLFTAFAYSWSVEIIGEGGFDYSEVVYTYNDQTGELEGDYETIVGAEYWNHHDVQVDENGATHVVYQIDQIGIQYATNESGAWVVQTLIDDPNISPSALELELDSDGDLHVLYGTLFEVVYLSNSTYSGNFVQWQLGVHAAGNIDIALELDSENNAHVFFVDFNSALQYREIEEPNAASSVSLTGASYGGVDFAHTSALTMNSDVLAQNVSVLAVPDIYDETDLYVGYIGPSVTVPSAYGAVHIVNGSYGSWSASEEYVFTTTSSFTNLDMDFAQNSLGNRHIVVNMAKTYWIHETPAGIWVGNDFFWHAETNGDLFVSETGDLFYSYFDAPDSSGVSELKVLKNMATESLVDYVYVDSIPANTAPGTVSMAASALDDLHLIYVDHSTPSYLKHATTEVFEPETQTLAATSADPYNDIAVDANGNIGISFQSSQSGDEGLSFSSYNGNTWVNDLVDTTGTTGYYNSVDFDPNGDAHIVYYSATHTSGAASRDLMHATNRTGSWVTQTLDGTGTSSTDVGKYNDMVIDGGGTMHISYYDEDVNELFYMVSDSPVHTGNPTWTKVNVDNGGGNDVGKYSSIGVTSAGRVFISYYDETLDKLKVANGQGSSWNTRYIDYSSSDQKGEYTSLVIDSQDQVNVSYYNFTTQSLDLAQRISTMTGMGIPITAWKTSTIDTGLVGLYSSLTVDTNDHLHVTYYAPYDTIMYANNVLGTWRADVLEDGVGVPDGFSSIAIDSNNKKHVSLFDDVPQDFIKYLSW